MRASGPNYLSHESEKRPPRYLVGCKDKVCSSEEWLSADGASPGEPNVPFRQTVKFPIEHVYRAICRHLSGIARQTGSVMCVTVQWFVLYSTWRIASKYLIPSPDSALRRVSRFSRESWSADMMTLQASCRTGHYVAAVMPVIDAPNRSEYQVLVFRQGHEVYQQTERSLEDAIRTASAYLDWQNEQDFDS